MILFLAILSLPVFTHEFTGDGEITARGCVEDATGYFAICTERDFPGGLPESFAVYLDINGSTTMSHPAGTGLEILKLCSFAGGFTALGQNPSTNSTAVFQVNEPNLCTEFQDQFMERAVMVPMGNQLMVAGNDFPDVPSVRVAVLDDNLELLSNNDYQGMNMMVADVSSVGGEYCVLGSTEQSGWQSDITLFFPETSAEYHFQPMPGRFEPVGIEPLEDGCVVIANSITDQNGMVGEIFLMKLASDMSAEWTASLGGASWLNATSSDITGEGIAVAGWTNDLSLSETNRSDLLIAEFSAEGQLLWTGEYGGDTADYALEIETCEDGGFLVSGCYVAGYYQGLLLRTDSLGTLAGMGLEPGHENTSFVSVYCNPSTDNSITVHVPEGDSRGAEVLILDMTGRTVRSAEPLNGVAIFNGLSAGIYLVVANTGSEIASARVVVTGGAP